MFSKSVSLLFDFDGVLVHTTERLKEIFFSYLKDMSSQQKERYFKKYQSESLREAIHFVSDISGQDIAVVEREYLNQVNAVYCDAKLSEIAKKWLRLYKYLGYKLAIVTSAKKSLVDTTLKEADIENIFDCIITEENGYGSKANGNAYSAAHQIIGMKSSIVIDDSDHNLRPLEATNHFSVFHFSASDDWNRLANKILMPKSVLEIMGLMSLDERRSVYEDDRFYQYDQDYWGEISRKKKLFNGPILISIENDPYTFYQSDYRHFVSGNPRHYASAVVAVVLGKNNRVLLGQRSAESFQEAKQWDFAPSGGVTAFPLYDQLLKECQEELGLTLELNSEVAICIKNPKDRTFEYIVPIKLDQELKFELNWEFEEISWFSKKNLPSGVSHLVKELIG